MKYALNKDNYDLAHYAIVFTLINYFYINFKILNKFIFISGF